MLQIVPSASYERLRTQCNPQLWSICDWRDEGLKSEILRVFNEHFRVYGVREVWLQLHREGVSIVWCIVECLMRGLGLQSVIRAKPEPTTINDKSVPCPMSG